jgi:hypothetical protein
MRSIFTLLFLSALAFIGFSQKNPALKPLKKVYGKEGLSTFTQTYGSIDLLIYAYDHAVTVVQNNGEKSHPEFPKATNYPVVHFTDLGIKLEPFTQYFQAEVPTQLIAIKSIYQLQLEFNAAKSTNH